jgi:hypothetical protein
MLMKNVNGVHVPLDEADLAQRAADEAAATPPGPRLPVSGRQFKAALALAGFISEAEMVSPELPAAVQPALAGMPTTERIIARATWAELSEVQGDEPLLLLFAATHTPPLGPEDIAALMATARAIP